MGDDRQDVWSGFSGKSAHEKSPRRKGTLFKPQPDTRHVAGKFYLRD